MDEKRDLVDQMDRRIDRLESKIGLRRRTHVVEDNRMTEGDQSVIYQSG